MKLSSIKRSRCQRHFRRRSGLFGWIKEERFQAVELGLASVEIEES